MPGMAFVGCRIMGYKCLEMILAKHAEDLSCVITLDEELAPNVAGFTSFDNLQAKLKVPYWKVKDVNSKEVLGYLTQISPQVAVQVAWSQIFNPQILAIPKHGWVGFHASLLPRYRGGAPVNWGIINGEKEWGMTMFYMTSGLDNGDIIDQIAFPITLKDTCRTVYEKATDCAVEMLDKHWTSVLVGNAPRRPQDEGEMTVVKRRKPKDGLIDWSKSAFELYNWIRALTHPYPGAFTYYKGKKVFVWEADWIDEGKLLLRRLQMEGEEEKDAEILLDEGGIEFGECFNQGVCPK